MDNKSYVVVAKDQHSVSIYEAGGEFKGTVFITSGQILGQPVVAGDTVTITVFENGKNWICVHSLPSLGFIRKISVS